MPSSTFTAPLFFLLQEENTCKPCPSENSARATKETIREMHPSQDSWRLQLARKHGKSAETPTADALRPVKRSATGAALWAVLFAACCRCLHGIEPALSFVSAQRAGPACGGWRGLARDSRPGRPRQRAVSVGWKMQTGEGESPAQRASTLGPKGFPCCTKTRNAHVRALISLCRCIRPRPHSHGRSSSNFAHGQAKMRI